MTTDDVIDDEPEPTDEEIDLAARGCLDVAWTVIRDLEVGSDPGIKTIVLTVLRAMRAVEHHSRTLNENLTFRVEPEYIVATALWAKLANLDITGDVDEPEAGSLPAFVSGHSIGGTFLMGFAQAAMLLQALGHASILCDLDDIWIPSHHADEALKLVEREGEETAKER